MKKKYLFIPILLLVAAAFVISVVYPLNKEVCIIKGRDTTLSLPSYISVTASIDEDAVAVNGSITKKFEISPSNPATINSEQTGNFKSLGVYTCRLY